MKPGQVVSINGNYRKVIRSMPIGYLVKCPWSWEFWVVSHNSKFKLIQDTNE